jgi:hypothetical protein
VPQEDFLIRSGQCVHGAFDFSERAHAEKLARTLEDGQESENCGLHHATTRV